MEALHLEEEEMECSSQSLLPIGPVLLTDSE